MNTPAAPGSIPNHLAWSIVSTVLATCLCCPLGLIGIVGIVFGGFGATGTHNAKRMFAYSTLAQVGFILVGIGWGTPLSLAAATRLALRLQGGEATPRRTRSAEHIARESAGNPALLRALALELAQTTTSPPPRHP